MEYRQAGYFIHSRGVTSKEQHDPKTLVKEIEEAMKAEQNGKEEI